MAILNVLRTATSSHWCWSWWALMSGESRPSYLLSVRTSTLWNQLFKLQFQFATSMTLSYRIHSKQTSHYRQDAAKRQTADIKFTQAKNQHFRPWGATRCTDRIHVKFGKIKGHVGQLSHTKFHAKRFTWVGTRPPKWQKFPLFGRVASEGRTLWPISTLFGAFIRTTILH